MAGKKCERYLDTYQQCYVDRTFDKYVNKTAEQMAAATKWRSTQTAEQLHCFNTNYRLLIQALRQTSVYEKHKSLSFWRVWVSTKTAFLSYPSAYTYQNY